ncbi:MAG: DUF4271 domain-containing protein [Winogradskyella sp.]|uniref:DUF4271 domain-containing protein n=1 Tax=Winogradskyella sp. TaxID=1883156 RepID=UPI0025E6173A|nr:DUF4271 domain-containing protein [Winogradskyella sp.]NRB60585.1 DUF4271 domain-containing protein [Winogradskyella sp.]
MRDFITHDWLTAFTVFGLLGIVISKILNTLRFNDFLYVVGNSKYLNIYNRDQKFIDPFEGFLFVNLVVSVSIFIFFFYDTYVETVNFELISFLKLLFTVATIIIIKILLERLLGSLFEIDSLIDNYLFQKITFFNYSGLIFMLSNLFILYTTFDLNIVIITTLILIFLLNLIGFITSFKYYQKFIISNFFYFLLYLCALEIAPYIILYKVIREYNI